MPKRRTYRGLLGATLVVGLGSRELFDGVPVLGAELGDALYAVMIYLLVRMVHPGAQVKHSAFVALAIVVGIELFQLTGIPADLADRPRRGRWFALALGRGFRWLDLVAITIGVCVAAAADFRYQQRPVDTINSAP